ncbi:MAG: ABC transporter ATP-binding protein [Endomicrobiales bacterium]
MSIEIKHLSKYFPSGSGDRKVLSDVTLSVRPGQLFALMGANGAGKTTLLKILATLILPTSGSLLVSGVDALLRPGEARRHLCLAHDGERNSYQVLTVEENLLFYGKLFGMSGKTLGARVSALAEEFGLAPWRAVKVHHCSSGIKQRLSIARALLPGPDVVLVDELTRSLDADAGAHVSRYLRAMASQRNKTCLVVTHDALWAKNFADSAGILIGGCIAPA